MVARMVFSEKFRNFAPYSTGYDQTCLKHIGAQTKACFSVGHISCTAPFFGGFRVP